LPVTTSGLVTNDQVIFFDEQEYLEYTRQMEGQTMVGTQGDIRPQDGYNHFNNPMYAPPQGMGGQLQDTYGMQQPNMGYQGMMSSYIPSSNVLPNMCDPGMSHGNVVSQGLMYPNVGPASSHMSNVGHDSQPLNLAAMYPPQSYPLGDASMIPRGTLPYVSHPSSSIQSLLPVGRAALQTFGPSLLGNVATQVGLQTLDYLTTSQPLPQTPVGNAHPTTSQPLPCPSPTCPLIQPSLSKTCSRRWLPREQAFALKEQAFLAQQKELEAIRTKAKQDQLEKLKAVHNSQLLSVKMDQLQTQLENSNRYTSKVTEELMHTKTALDLYAAQQSPSMQARNISHDSSSVTLPNPLASNSNIGEFLSNTLQTIVNSPKAITQTIENALDVPKHMAQAVVESASNAIGNAASNVVTSLIGNAKSLITNTSTSKPQVTKNGVRLIPPTPSNVPLPTTNLQSYGYQPLPSAPVYTTDSTTLPSQFDPVIKPQQHRSALPVNVASSKPQSTQSNQAPLITFSSSPPAHSQPLTSNAIAHQSSSYDPWHSKHLAPQNKPPAMYPTQNPLGVVTPPQPSKKVLDTRAGTGMTPPPTTRGNIKVDPNPLPTNAQPCCHVHPHSQPMNVPSQHPTQHPFGPHAPTLNHNGPQCSLAPSQPNPPISHLTQQVLNQHNAMYPPQPSTNLINLDSNPPVMSSTKFLNQANRVTQPSPPSVQQPLLPLNHQYSHTLPTQVPQVTNQHTVKLDPHLLHSHPLPQQGTHQHPTLFWSPPHHQIMAMDHTIQSLHMLTHNHVILQ
jgi:hypothetical protein